MSTRESPYYLEVAGATHIGGRHANEDFYGYDQPLGVLAVADGVSSRPAPRVAAEAAITALFDYLTDSNVTSPAEARERVERALAHVHRHIRDQAADEQLRGMASALAFAMERGKTLLVGHVGDCRVIRVRDGHLEPLTTDQRPETSALGLYEGVIANVCVEGLRPNDGVLVTTRGLTAALDDDAIVAALQHAAPRAIVNELIRRATARGNSDNVTCVYGHWRPILL